MTSEWYKDAIFYEVYVRGFYDLNGDGVGDFRGLTARLDYLEWLGKDAGSVLCPPNRIDRRGHRLDNAD